jgi:DNA mismatch repair protein MutL
MPIQILPPMLANQIAAGEVVERPSSVIKELVENSLDAGATRVDVELEKGGCQLIRVRDNGSGISGSELSLALARHATSKVATLDDLEHIASLGFRGEALASISSVSRLTLTSRTASQHEAWQAYAEGREMAVTVKPAAHPVGTTVEVLDLFFNTPARRRFLRSEKTEFSHIDELLRRLALSRFDVALSLKHNGKLLRQYRAAETPQQQEQRVIQACGTEFMQAALRIDSEHLGLHLYGWLSPHPLTNISEVQYCYVNGRMMRDKLLNHAIRQAYTEYTGMTFQPAHILYLELDPHQVDVNVHPSKHEVRFHESRQVHDFIVQVIGQAFQAVSSTDTAPSGFSRIEETAPDYPVTPLKSRGTGQHQYIAPTSRYTPPSSEQLNRYNELLNSPWSSGAALKTDRVFTPENTDDALLRIVQQRYLLSVQEDLLLLSDLAAIQAQQWQEQCHSAFTEGLISQPLLIPLRLEITQSDEWLMEYQTWLQKQGLRYKRSNHHQLIVQGVPAYLRQTDLALSVPALLKQLETYPAHCTESDWQRFISEWLQMPGILPSVYSMESARLLWSWLQQNITDWQTNAHFTRAVDVTQIIEAFSRA